MSQYPPNTPFTREVISGASVRFQSDHSFQPSCKEPVLVASAKAQECVCLCEHEAFERFADLRVAWIYVCR